MADLNALIESRVNEVIEILSRFAQVTGVFLFGSYVDGKPDEYSDIDLGVFVEGIEEWDILKRVKTGALVQKEAGDDIELHFFPATSLDNPEPASFCEYVIQHGKQLEIN